MCVCVTILKYTPTIDINAYINARTRALLEDQCVIRANGWSDLFVLHDFFPITMNQQFVLHIYYINIHFLHENMNSSSTSKSLGTPNVFYLSSKRLDNLKILYTH
jgi:hypothetical protein